MNSILLNQLNSYAENYRGPCFLYSQEIILNRLSELKLALPSHFKILYSLKANSFCPLVNVLAEQGAWCDVASIEECNIALEAGVPAQNISWTGPGKLKQEIDELLQKKIGYINAESPDELQYLVERKSSFTKNIVRHSWPESGSQFGFDIEAIESFENINGIHAFWKSQLLNEKELLAHFSRTIDLAFKMKEKGMTIDVINFGSGIGIPYFEKEINFNLQLFGENLQQLLVEKEVQKNFPTTSFFVESGRYLVGQSGFYLSKVLYKKYIHGKAIVILDGGFHHFMAATAVGQLLRRPFPLYKLGKNDEFPKEVVTIAGKTCSPSDIFAVDCEFPVLNPGDVIAIGNAGSYGLSYSPVSFSRYKSPEEILF